MAGIPIEMTQDRTQGRTILLPHLERVKLAAERDRQTRFTALLHHVDVDSLRRSFERQKPKASPGVDGETVGSYAEGLEARLADLHERVHSGRYRPQPIKRVMIPKPDGGERPLGLLVLEDKIVQGAVTEVLNAIYEVDFVDCSYGFRPGRSTHDALEALRDGLMWKPVSYVLDADLRKFFDSIDHELMLRAVQQRIADPRILRLIEQWLRAGVLESGELKQLEEGTPQGAGISPLLANIFLHYVLDKWVERWIREKASGHVMMVRYADDFVIGFQFESVGRSMLADLKERFRKCGLSLNEDKTRLIEFGRFIAQQRKRKGERRPDTFAFLGFTHYCARSREGQFTVKRKTQSKRMRRKLKELRKEARRRMHTPVADQHKWLKSVLRGHYQYYGLPCNNQSMYTFWREVRLLWFRSLRRRSRRKHLRWGQYLELLEVFPLPTPKTTHPWQPAKAA